MPGEKKYSIPELILIYERKNRFLALQIMEQVMALMDKGSTEIAYLAAKKKLLKNRFLPLEVKKSIDRITTTFHANASNVILNGINRARRLADEKNDLITESYFGGGKKPPSRRIIQAAAGGSGRRPPGTPINQAADKFGSHFNARSLSPRVWKLSNSYKATIKKTLVAQMKEGTPARKIAKTLRSNLRNSEGSETPGRGVYKSPQKNALRLTATETNLAYEHQDFERWQKLWFVVGIEIKLSNNHPVYDICDSLVGRYPKDFLFPGFHPFCRCIAVPILAPQDARDKMLDYQLGSTKEKPTVEYISTIPERTQQWTSKNAERIQGWNNTPYVFDYNQKYFGNQLSKK
ncbi:structural protein [Flavitalea antarctica]